MSKNFPTATALVRNKFCYFLINVIHWDSIKSLRNFASVAIAVAYTDKCFTKWRQEKRRFWWRNLLCPWVMEGGITESLLGNHYKAPVNSGIKPLSFPFFLGHFAQEWSPSHNLKSLRKKQLAAREAMARQTVASDTEVSSVESSVIRYPPSSWWNPVLQQLLFSHHVPFCWWKEYFGTDSWVHTRQNDCMGLSLVFICVTLMSLFLSGVCGSPLVTCSLK